MLQRGRKSAARAATLAPLAPTRAIEPDAILTPAEREVWDSLVGSKPAGFFNADSVPLLEGLARCVAMTRWLASRIVEAQAADDIDKLATLLKLNEREQRGAASLATKLRLTPQARFQPVTAGRQQAAHDAAAVVDPTTGARKVKPWENPMTGKAYN
jgi:hypothetical protein